MSLLEMYKRPVVVFDAKNAEHRKWFAHFARNHTWKGCPVRFVVTDSTGQLTNNLIVGMTDQVAHFYLNQEFKKKKSYYKRKTDVQTKIKTIPSTEQQKVSV